MNQERKCIKDLSDLNTNVLKAYHLNFTMEIAHE